MTSPERSPRRLDPSVRGLLVLAAVVVLGLLLLAKAAPSSSTTIATRTNPGPNAPSTSQPGRTTTTRPPVTTPTTLGVAHPKAQVKVLVLNGTGGKIALASGINGRKLKARGYNVLAPANAIAHQTSAVFYAPGYHVDAVAIGKVLHIPAASAVPVPTPPPAPNASLANVIVLLGQDTPA